MENGASKTILLVTVEDPRDARGVCHTAEATGVIGTVTDSTVRVPRTQVPRVTWANVVRKAPAATQSERARSDRRYEVLLKRSGGVSRSFSQNNPSRRIKV